MTHSSQATEIKRLETDLENETQSLLKLRGAIAKAKLGRDTIEQTILKDKRAGKFYADKLLQIDIHNIKSRLNKVDALCQEILAKRQRATQLQRALEEFDGLEPTDDALRQKVEDLKKSRLSLDMTFVD